MAVLGHTIGRYQIHFLLGQGSMGVVYCAHDPQLDRDVAVKTIHMPAELSPYQRDKRTQSLLNEARLAARLSHPGIVKVFDAGEQEGEPYIVLERVEGRTLARLLAEEGALAPETAVTMMREILEAVANAHEQGLVHRDLKPANIMVQPDGHVRIMDFGIAHLVGDSRIKAGKLTGTPRYMSPEQIGGQVVDMRSDVFALGVIFYEILSGQHPFPQVELDELARAIREARPAPLHARAANLPPGGCALIERAMAKRPEERFPSARQMLEALMAARVAMPPADCPQGAIVDFIIRKIERRGDFPTTMQYISTITHTARREDSSAHTIAQEILKDFALTGRILRMVNSPFYNGGRHAISTISRAVVQLGVDAVLDLAAGLSIFEHFHNKCDVPTLKAQTVQALMTAFHAREIAAQIGYENAEEAFICGMMHHLGRLIVAFYFPEEYAAIEHLVRQGELDEATAAHQVMRISFGELGEAIAQSWRLPEAVMKCCRGLDPSHQGRLKTPHQILQGVVSLASELSKATMIADETRRAALQAAVARQFEGRLDLNPRQLGRVVENSIRNAWDISHALRLNLKDLGVADTLLATVPPPEEAGSVGGAPGQEASPSQTLQDPLDDVLPPEQATAFERQEFLMTTIGEITTALMGTYQLNDVLMMVLEGMYRGVGSQHVLLALVNPQRSLLTYRFGLGPGTDRISQVFQVPLNAAGGLPAQCILEGREIFIADLPAEALPGELHALLHAKSLLLMPIVVREMAIGLFLLDRAPDQSSITKQDLLNLRTLANQALLAIRQCQGKR